MTDLLREKIYQTIRDQITYEILHPGERLTEAKLVKEFKTSRSPIREALRQLESEGFVTSENHKGHKVSKLAINEVDEIYTMRWLLESHAAGLTANQATKKDVANLKKIHKKLKKAAKDYDLEKWLENNSFFHDYLDYHCGNTHLLSAIRLLKRKTYRYKYMIVRSSGHFDTYLKHHEQILSACQENNGKKAERYSKLHIKSAKKILIDYLNKSSELIR
jgi:DNA-binding GntR family transcriptional regulator